MSEQNKRGEIPNEFYELQGLKNQREKLEASYREIFPKVDTYLLHDLLLRLKDDPKEAPMYTVEVFTKEGTDTQASRDHILATTGTVPGIYDKGRFEKYRVKTIVPVMPIVCAIVSTSDNPNSNISSAFLLI